MDLYVNLNLFKLAIWKQKSITVQHTKKKTCERSKQVALAWFDLLNQLYHLLEILYFSKLWHLKQTQSSPEKNNIKFD